MDHNNWGIKLNIAQFQHVMQDRKKKDGTMTKCIIIPLTENHIFLGEKGAYLDLSGIVVKNPAAGMKDTHLIKQSFPKEVYDAMTEEQRKATPILGNMKPFEMKNGADAVIVEVAPDDDDLPF